MSVWAEMPTVSLDHITETGHEQVSYFHDEETGLEAIVAIYDTRLGPAVGGTRFYDYDTEADALDDALRLSEAMAYKCAAADIDFGGGKAVIVGDPAEKTDDLLRAYGRVVDSFGGRFVTGEDVNVDTDDLAVIGEETPYVGGGDIGAGTAVTAEGVRHGIEAALAERYGDDTLAGRSVLVQGCGKVGSELVARLADRSADVLVADVDDARVQRMVEAHDATPVAPDAVYDTSCDVFAPCAMGGVIDDGTVDRLACDIVCGSANNQLAARRHARALADRDALYVPDYVVNAGGLVAGHVELEGGDVDDALAAVEGVRDRLERMFDTAREEGITPLDAADRYAERRMAEA